MRHIIATFVLASALSGCAAPLTWAEILHNQTHQFTNENGDPAWSIECEDPTVCMQLAGLRCPGGYVKSDAERSTRWSAEHFGRFGSFQLWHETRFAIVCRAPTAMTPLHDTCTETRDGAVVRTDCVPDPFITR